MQIRMVSLRLEDQVLKEDIEDPSYH